MFQISAILTKWFAILPAWYIFSRDAHQAYWHTKAAIKLAMFCIRRFKKKFLNKRLRIWIQISLKFAPAGPIDKSSLVQISAWCRTGNKLLSELMLAYCNKPQWINMMTSSNGNIFRVTGPLCGEFTGPGEFPTQRPVTRSFDVFFDLRLNKRLNKESWGWWFETLSRPFWRHRNELPLQVVWLNWLPIQRQSPKAQWKTLYEVWLPWPRQNHPLQTGKLENWEVFLYTWWPPKISFHEIVNL